MADVLQVKYNDSWHSIPAIRGEKGAGVPTGGNTKQVLVKKTNTDYDTEWVDSAAYDSTNERITWNG